MQHNAADRKQVRRAEKQARVDDRARREITVQIMDTTPGRAWMLEKLESCHIFHTSFSTDPVQMAYNEGERNVGLKLLDDIMRACPDDYVTMMKERNIRDTADERHNADSTGAEHTGGEDGNGGAEGSEPNDPGE